MRSLADSPYSPQSVPGLSPIEGPFLIERHRPTTFAEPFHHHLSLEVNYLQGGAMIYGFGGTPVEVPPGRIVLFWGTAPHRVLDIRVADRITNLYLPLATVLGWRLPGGLSGRLMSGAVLAAPHDPMDGPWLDRLWAERTRSTAWRALHLSEIELRLRRAALTSFDTLRSGAGEGWSGAGRAMRQVEAMLTAVAERYTSSLPTAEVAAAAGLSPSQGAALLRRVTGQTIKGATTRMRLAHATALLAGGESKVAVLALDSGFLSLSAFYDAFRREFGESPAQWRRRQGRAPDGEA